MIATLFLIGSAIALLPQAEARTCNTLAYHPLTGNPMAEHCPSGYMTEADSRIVECHTLVSNPLNGAPVLQECTDTYCNGATCWTIHTIYRVGGDSNDDVGIWNGCGAAPAEDAFCAYGVSGPFTVFVYVDQQEATQPGVCYTGGGCYITDLDG